MNDIVLAADGVSKTYERSMISSVLLQDRLLKWRLQRKTTTVNALFPSSLSVRRGEWVGMYGPNGSGKTTMLRILGGLLRPDTGTVSLHGSLSCFFELGIGFHPERRAEENIYLHGLLQGYSRKEIRAMTDRIINFAGIESALDLPLKCYSTGMRLRLAFAAAAQVDRDLYLFDEILAVGDADFQEKCKEHLRALRAQGKTAVLVSHDFDELGRFTDRIVHMNHGRMAAPATALPV